MEMIPSAAFYSTYHGHEVGHLHALLDRTFPPHIYLAGDSTVDNKYWLAPASYPSPPQYNCLSPPRCRRDIAYWLTKQAPPSHPFTAINCAVEESTLRERSSRLLVQDEVIRGNLSEHDVLVVSAGGNDIALRPTLRTAAATVAAVYFGGGTGALEDIFVRQTKAYVARLVERRKPRLVVVCGLYFMDEANVDSWAGLVLKVLGYNWRPKRVQEVQRRIFDRMKGMEVEGVEVVTVPLFEALDGKCSEDYVARVEPSEKGGEKIARLLWDVITKHVPPLQGKEKR